MNFEGYLWFLYHARQCSIIHGRLTQVVEGRNLVAEEQGGFRRRRGCRDQLLTLVLLGQMKMLSKKGKAYV